MANRTVIKIDDLVVGIKLPVAIYDARKTSLLLLNHSVELTDQMLNKLRDRGISRVSIDSEFAAAVCGQAPAIDSAAAAANRTKTAIAKLGKPKTDPNPRKTVVRQTPTREKPSAVQIQQANKARTENKNELGQIYKNIMGAAKINKKAVDCITLNSIENIAQDMDLFLGLSLENCDTDEDYIHAMRVAELAISVAINMDVPQNDIKMLGMGCLLHRAGMTPRARELSMRAGSLSEIEKLEFRKIPNTTFDLMAKCSEIDVIARQVAYQIHERWDGSGYPRRKAGIQIHPLARIAGLCDEFVALTSPRPYRPALSGYEAVREIINETRQGKFEPQVVRALLQTVSLFPIGSYVKLSNGEIAKVMRSEKACYDRPVVLVISSDKHETLILKDNPEILIEEILESKEEVAYELWQIGVRNNEDKKLAEYHSFLNELMLTTEETDEAFVAVQHESDFLFDMSSESAPMAEVASPIEQQKTFNFLD
jgi:HD-GYP domain-containing protein (c-di-GMP phosphodiesterase class II)